MIRRGLDGVIIYPSGVIGPNDFKPSEVGQMIIDFIRGRLPLQHRWRLQLRRRKGRGQRAHAGGREGRTGGRLASSPASGSSVTDVQGGRRRGGPSGAQTEAYPRERRVRSPKRLTSLSRMTGKKPLVSLGHDRCTAQQLPGLKHEGAAGSGSHRGPSGSLSEIPSRGFRSRG